MRSRRLILVTVVLVMMVGAGCGQGRATDPRQVKLAMGFVPNVQFAPVYVALEKGYFSDEGIKIDLDYGMESDLLQEVGTGHLQFAIASGDQVILARAGGLPVAYVFDWYQRFPVCVVSMAEDGITSPKQLVGRTVGTPALQGASYIGWLAFLDQVGIDPQSIDLQVIGYTQFASLVESRVDAAICYALNEPVQMQAAGYETNVFYLDDYTRLISNGIVANDSTIADDPELVHAITRAFRRGLQETLNDPDGAFEITRKVMPEMDQTTAKLQRAVLQECLNFWESDNLGYSDPQAWVESVDLMTRLGLLTTNVVPTDLFTNQFVD